MADRRVPEANGKLVEVEEVIVPLAGTGSLDGAITMAEN